MKKNQRSGSRAVNHRPRGRPAAPGRVRIIAGDWRGRRLPVADLVGLRPTPDRVRETLFNWLAPLLPGSHCLDLFAGSGALGLEAASRGAGQVTLVEQHPQAVSVLKQVLEDWSADQVSLLAGDALEVLPTLPQRAWDVIFLDPPFAADLQHTVLNLLRETAALKPDGVVYCESPAQGTGLSLPHGWQCLKQKRVAGVQMQLLLARPGPDAV